MTTGQGHKGCGTYHIGHSNPPPGGPDVCSLRSCTHIVWLCSLSDRCPEECLWGPPCPPYTLHGSLDERSQTDCAGHKCCHMSLHQCHTPAQNNNMCESVTVCLYKGVTLCLGEDGIMLLCAFVKVCSPLPPHTPPCRTLQHKPRPHCQCPVAAHRD